MNKLRERLRDIELPDSIEARLATAEKAAGLTPQTAQRSSALSRLRPVLVACVVVVALGGFALTPPGQAVTDQLGELIGVGDVGGPPTEPSQVGNYDPANGQIVLATGVIDATPFEIVAYRSDRSISGREDSTICVNVEFPTVGAEMVESCYAGALRYGGLCCSGLTLRDEASSVPRIEGEIRPGIERVEVAYTANDGTEREVEAVIGMITPEFAEELGVEHPSGKFVATLPDLAEQTDLPGPYQGPAAPIRIEVFDGAGELVEAETINPVREQRIRNYEDAQLFRETVDERRKAIAQFHEQCDERYDRDRGAQTEIHVDELEGRCLELFEASRVGLD